MLPGYNHNIMHKGITFHVQTEDNGVDNPHIMTHLFIGGNILATKKTNYMDIIKVDGLDKIVADIMKEQHKKMVMEIRDGVYDSHALVEELIKKKERENKKQSEHIKDAKSDESVLNIDEEAKNLDEVILDYLVETTEDK